jgi:chaperonin GroES
VNPLNLKTKLSIDSSVTKAKNLCDRFTAKDLDTIGNHVWEGYDRDVKSRQHWVNRMEAGMDLAMQIQKEKNFPWPGASNVIFPLVTIASLQFSARSYENIIQGDEVVKYRRIGEDKTGLIKARADRISKHMSWQVLEEDESWEEQHDRLLINLSIVGTAFVKTSYSSKLGYVTDELVMARDFVIDYWAKSVETASRKTQIIPLYRNEIYERCKSQVFRDVLTEEWYVSPMVPVDTNPQQDNRQGLDLPPVDFDTPLRCLEQHCLFDFDQDGYSEPYIVIIEERSRKVLRIVARWFEDSDIDRTDSGEIIRIRATEYFTKFSFIPAADGGIYDTGFGVLLGPLNEGVNTGINQLFDAGTMITSNGGFLGRGAKIRGGVYTFAPWEWKRVDSTGDDLRKSLVPFPVREPSNVLFQLIGLLIEYTDRIAGTQDQMVGKNPGQNTPAETSRNTLEQGMQVYSVIFKRVWRSFKQEFKKRHKLNGRFLPVRQAFGDKDDFIRREDYQSSPDQVVPVADPRITSRAMQIAKASTVRQAAAEVPGYDRPKVERRWLRAMQEEGIDDIYPGPENVPPLPNPKMQIEEAKLKGKQMDLDFERQKLVATLQTERGEVQARIAKLRAETLVLIHGIKTAETEARLQTFEAIVEALETHNNMLNNSIQTLSGLAAGGESGTSPGTGVGQVADATRNSSPAPAPA